MQSETEDVLSELESFVPLRANPRSFELYEEYSSKDLTRTTIEHKESYEKADPQARREIVVKTEAEIRDFREWLESEKKFAPQMAHYYSISLKGLLIGLPGGVEIARLFGTVLEGI